METSIESAIARSISHNEIVAVAIDDQQSVIDQIDEIEGVECVDSAATEIDCRRAVDVWGKRNGRDFRIHVFSV